LEKNWEDHKMNSKERVKKALDLEVPDKIPFGEFAIDFDTAEKILGHETYLRAKAKSQIAFWEGRRDEVVQSWKEDTVELYGKLDSIDIVNLASMASGIVPPKDYIPNPPKKIAENTWEDEEGRIFKLSETTADITMVHDPKMWDREYKLEDYAKEPDCNPPDSTTIFEVVDYVIERLGNQKFIIGPSGNPAEMVMLGEMERALTEYILNPDVVKAAADFYMKQGNFEDQFYVRTGQDAVLWGQDFAYKSGPMISPEMFSEFIVPYVKERVKNLETIYNMPVIKHACGNNWKLMDMFIEIGYKCYQSIQPTAYMDIREVKEVYGKKICLWGGIPVEHLVNGTVDEIKKDVVYAVESARIDGGYIFGSSHSIAVGTKYNNFMTMMEEFEKIRHYL
jgi:uroporphyrinogen-III decarboxylase